MKDADAFVLKSDAERAREKRVAECRVTAMRYIGLGGKSSGRVRERLRDAGYGQEVIDACIEGLIRDAYIDDRALARAVIRQRTGRRAESRRALMRRMDRQGIAPEVAEVVVREEAPDDAELLEDFLEARCRKDLEALQREDITPDEVHRIVGRIGRRAEAKGFSADRIMRGIERWRPMA